MKNGDQERNQLVVKSHMAKWEANKMINSKKIKWIGGTLERKGPQPGPLRKPTLGRPKGGSTDGGWFPY